MKIKSLLYGSAAALVAATGAKAADAIVIAEPEPVEYVRVCDAYGAGFFYIPGTETCMRIGGEIRFQMGGTNAKSEYGWAVEEDRIWGEPIPIWDGVARRYVIDESGSDTPNYHGYTHGGWNNTARARVFVDVRSDTEWGTLQGYVRMQFDRTSGSDGAGSSAVANHAWLSLGGLRMGWTDSAWYSSVNGGPTSSGSHSDSQLHNGYQQRNLLQYNFSGGNGFFATLSLEDDNGGTTYGRRVSAGPGQDRFFTNWEEPVAGVLMNAGYKSDNYVPDVVLRAGVSQGWGAVWGVVAYDEDRTNDWTALMTGPNARLFWRGGPTPSAFLGYGASQRGKSGWAAQLGAQINVPSMPGSSLRVIGYYADSDNAYNGHGGEWSIIGSYGHQFTPEFFASAGVQYTDSLYLPGSDIKSSSNRWDAELFATWRPVENFQVMGEVVYSKQTDLDGSWSGFLRFSRFF